ncbi:MAG: hypothetical protein AMJ69_00215 [Gammaproteobacteria bacterium SG8_47]|nr:MAG: hypothetical protein AMJ69_00215 [Gammaproteobacteria bacterium SG8_47]
MSHKHANIMVIDGSSVTRTILSRILRNEIEDVNITVCATGQEALQQLTDARFDLVTTALLLPDMDGLELSRNIRLSDTYHYTPIIVVSGDADARLLREGFAAGVTDYFDKSEGYKAFGDFVKSFIERHAKLVGTVLYVEDSPTTAKITRAMLDKRGLKVVHTSTAEQALELLEQARDANGAQKTYDVLITDFYLKGRLTGGDLLHAIRARYHFSQQELPVLVLTSDDETQKQIEVFHAGANDFVTKPIVEEILMARLRALLLIKHQYDALKRQAETMRWVAATDSLTGVRNKRYLVDNGDDYITNPAHLPVTAMLIDIDHFKSINDTLGHITGDHVLAAIGELLNSSFPHEMVVRFGGEEFCVLLSQADQAQALTQAEALRRDVERLRPVDVAVTVSVGLACTLDHPNERLTKLLSLADRALYRAKATGRNRVYVHTADGLMDAPSLARVGT